MVQVHAEVEADGRDEIVFQAPALRWCGAAGDRGRAHEALLRHLDVQLVDLSELSGADALAQFAHHRVAAVVEGDGEEVSCRVVLGEQGASVVQVCHQRLLTDDRDTGLEQGLHDLVVIRCRCQHHHGVETRALGKQQIAPAAVKPVGCHVPVLRRLPVGVCVAAEHAGIQRPAAIHPAGGIVCLSNR